VTVDGAGYRTLVKHIAALERHSVAVYLTRLGSPSSVNVNHLSLVTIARGLSVSRCFRRAL
jgi:hypothetical protein